MSVIAQLGTLRNFYIDFIMVLELTRSPDFLHSKTLYQLNYRGTYQIDKLSVSLHPVRVPLNLHM